MAIPKIIIDSLARLCGVLLVVSGAWGLFDPLHVARDIFAVASATEETVVFYPGLAGRNLGAGLAVLAISFSGQRKALGMLLLCWLCAGFSDTYICLTRPDAWNTGTHMFNICWIGFVAVCLLNS